MYCCFLKTQTVKYLRAENYDGLIVEQFGKNVEMILKSL
jgi:hypothetical protein